MNAKTKSILQRVSETATFAGVDFATVNARNSDGDNALHCTVGWGDYEATQTLINEGIDVNAFGDNGYTPLHIACQYKNLEIVKLLVESGADIITYNDGDTPFMIARMFNNDDVCDYLGGQMKLQNEKLSLQYLLSRKKQLEREIDRIQHQINILENG